MSTATQMWMWCLKTIFADFLATVKLHPFRFVGEPEVDVVQQPNKRALRVCISFDMEPM